MIISAMITQLRRVYRDMPKATQSQRDGDGSSTLFNLGSFPVVESSYTIQKAGVTQTETTHFTLDKDNGDLNFVAAPANGASVQANYKYANFRDQNWVEAINHGIETLNARGYFRQVVRNSAIMRISAGIRLYSAPSACIDLYELLESDNNNISGNPTLLGGNWSYQQDANKVVLGFSPTAANRAWISYLRNLQTYNATSATLDVLQDWVELVKLRAGSYYFRSMAAKIAQQANANIDEGHFSFTNLRTMANDLDTDFEKLAARKKPTRPAKGIQYNIPGTKATA